jgi:hypothetical protein
MLLPQLTNSKTISSQVGLIRGTDLPHSKPKINYIRISPHLKSWIPLKIAFGGSQIKKRTGDFFFSSQNGASMPRLTH